MKTNFLEIPPDVAAHYNLENLVYTDRYVYIEIRKGMPDLKQAEKIANKRLTKHLAKYGYFPCARTPALWRHQLRNITFALVVNDFGVKYVRHKHFQHLIDALCDLYEILMQRIRRSTSGNSGFP